MERLIDKIADFLVERPRLVKLIKKLFPFLTVLLLVVFIVSYAFLIIEYLGFVSSRKYHHIMYLISYCSFSGLLPYVIFKAYGEMFSPNRDA